jgi:hypothetical protein
MRAATFPENNFKNNTLSLPWQRAQVTDFRQVSFETEKQSSGITSHSVGKEKSTRSYQGKGRVLSWTN